MTADLDTLRADFSRRVHLRLDHSDRPMVLGQPPNAEPIPAPADAGAPLPVAAPLRHPLPGPLGA